MEFVSTRDYLPDDLLTRCYTADGTAYNIHKNRLFDTATEALMAEVVQFDSLITSRQIDIEVALSEINRFKDEQRKLLKKIVDLHSENLK
jgi:hypothetical protein